MVHRHSSVSEAYSVLGLQQGASLETVKTAYKQLALRTHPDKNQNNPDATVQFQQISSAYNVLLKHLDTSTPPPMPYGFSPFHHTSHSHSHSAAYEYSEDDDTEDYYDSGDEHHYDEEEEDLDFFMFLFDEMLNGRANRFAGARFQSRRRGENVETEGQYQARMQKQREEQLAAAQRRKAQEDAWRLRRQAEREDEARAGEERRKQKAETKKAEAEASRRSAAQKVRSQQQKSQTLRSAVFAAARRGNVAKVKQAVWEEGVDAAGGEVKPGMEEYVDMMPEDPKQTLLHLAVVHGNLELVEWLDRHNAEADERDSQERTAFHVALQYGHVPIIRYFFDAYPPKDSDSIPVLHASDVDKVNKSVLRLALESGEPEVVWLVLDSSLADSKAVLDAWTWLCTNEGQARREFGYVGKREKAFDEQKFEETKDLLMSWGGFTPPPTPQDPPAETLPQGRSAEASSHAKKGKKNRKQSQQIHMPSPPDSPPIPQSIPTPPPSHHSPPPRIHAPQKQGAPPGRGKSGKGRARGDRGRTRDIAPPYNNA